MAEKTNISWTNHTFNPVQGCEKVSPGCKNCYAEALVKRYGGDFSKRRRTSDANWKQPLKWNKRTFRCKNGCDGWWPTNACGECGEWCAPKRPKVFCASMADWLDDKWPIEVLADLLKLIHDTPNLDWQLLTKRPENFPERVALATYIEGGPIYEWASDWIHSIAIPKNIWIGTSVENQEYADRRIPELLKIPAKVRFLSCEPLLGPVSLNLTKPVPIIDDQFGDQHEYHEVNRGIHQVIVGGESGGKRRPMNLEWAQSIRLQCEEAGTAFFFKQISAFKSGCLDGVPAELMKQEFPK